MYISDESHIILWLFHSECTGKYMLIWLIKCSLLKRLCLHIHMYTQIAITQNLSCWLEIKRKAISFVSSYLSPPTPPSSDVYIKLVKQPCQKQGARAVYRMVARETWHWLVIESQLLPPLQFQFMGTL